jgi:hypothetical protein
MESDLPRMIQQQYYMAKIWQFYVNKQQKQPLQEQENELIC